MKAVMQAHDLSIGYTRPEYRVANSINAALHAGELVCLLGPNGAGKSTLIRTLSAMQAPLSGHVTLQGDGVTSLNARDLAQRLSVVLTERVDVGMLNGWELVALGRHPYTDWTGNYSKQDEKIIRWAVDAVGATDLAPRPVNTLSDGERQKLMIARALAQDPVVIILDEPTAYLDLPRRVEIMQLLRRLARQTKRAILLSTHDLDLALRHADRIWLMPKGGDLQTGAPEDLVLSGAFERAFASEGVHFDPVTGSFKPTLDHCAAIKVIGEGLPHIWLTRALERNGYAISEAAAISVKIEDSQFNIEYEGTTHTVESIYNVLQQLNTLILETL